MLKPASLLALSALILAACAGTPFKWSAARQVQPGMTTAQVAQLVGPPNTVRASGETLTYVWVYVSSFSGTRTLRIDFKDDRAISAPPIPPEFQD